MKYYQLIKPERFGSHSALKNYAAGPMAFTIIIHVFISQSGSDSCINCDVALHEIKHMFPLARPNEGSCKTFRHLQEEHQGLGHQGEDNSPQDSLDSSL